jgi:hypothetical protein
MLADAPFRGAGRAEDQAIVWLHDVDDPVDALLHEELEAVAVHGRVTGPPLIGQLETHAVLAAEEADVGFGIEPPSRLVGAP